MIAYVEAPTWQLYGHWLALRGYKAKDYPFLEHEADLTNYFGPIYVLNGGSLDPHIRSHVNRYCRAQQVPIEVLT